MFVMRIMSKTMLYLLLTMNRMLMKIMVSTMMMMMTMMMMVVMMMMTIMMMMMMLMMMRRNCSAKGLSMDNKVHNGFCLGSTKQKEVWCYRESRTSESEVVKQL